MRRRKPASPVIYFTTASYLELVVSFLFVAVSSALSFLLVPRYGAEGAAIALLTSSLVSCVAFALLSRRYYRMPVDPTALAVMPALAALFVFAAHETTLLLPPGALPLVLNAFAFALFGGFAIRHFGLLRMNPAESLGETMSVL